MTGPIGQVFGTLDAMAEWQVELSWTCAGCKSRVLGRFTSCPSCGKPKENEEYEMPGDAAAQPAVADPALLALATAGENWRCAFCGSDQRARDGSCGRCGAGQSEARARAAASPAPLIPSLPSPPAPRSRWPLFAVLGVGAVIACAVVIGVALGAGRRHRAVAVRTTDETRRTVRVARASWEHVITVDAWQLLPREGFADTVPPGAVEVRSLGEREHHQDRVPDGFDTETYTVDVPDGYRTESYTVEVPDGYRTETTTERVACGETCTPKPQSCRSVCTNNKNGFATCKDVCTGGGQSCSTRYCDQPRTKQIPRTRTETRTRQIPKTKTETRTRQVPRFKMVPRMAPFSAWKEWGWAEARTVKEQGEGGATRWPDPKLAPDKNGQPQERARRAGIYRVELVDARGDRYTYTPRDEAELARVAARTDEFRARVLPTVELPEP